MNRKFQSYLCLIAVLIAGALMGHGRFVTGFAFLALFCAALGIGYRTGYCYANTLSNTNFTILGQKVLEAFTAYMTPITVFATNFKEAEVQRGNKVKVSFVPLAADALDFVDKSAGGTGYAQQDSEMDGLDVTIDKRKYVSWNLTAQEMADNPMVNLERFAHQKGFALAKAVLTDIWGLVTQANYGAPIYTGPAATFDSDAVSDIETACDDALWPSGSRGLILKPSYANNLTKDGKIVGTVGLEQSQVLQRSRVGTIHNFDTFKSPFVPTNAQNLVGMAVHPDAIAIASRVIVPDDPSKIIRFERFTDPNNLGLTIAFREWTDPDGDQTKRVFEFNYGKLKINGNAIKRIVSA